MSKFTIESKEINYSKETAFDYLSNIDNRPEWQDALISIERNSKAPDKKGASWKDNFKSMGMKISASMRYTDFERPNKFIESIEMPTSKGRIDMIINETNNGCSVTVISDLNWKGIFKLFRPIIEKGLKKGIQQDLINIKRILESKNS